MDDAMYTYRKCPKTIIKTVYLQPFKRKIKYTLAIIFSEAVHTKEIIPQSAFLNNVDDSCYHNKTG